MLNSTASAATLEGPTARIWFSLSRPCQSGVGFVVHFSPANAASLVGGGSFVNFTAGSQLAFVDVQGGLSAGAATMSFGLASSGDVYFNNVQPAGSVSLSIYLVGACMSPGRDVAH